jgi:tetratricopeptide (TPR) repeat protein
MNGTRRVPEDRRPKGWRTAARWAGRPAAVLLWLVITSVGAQAQLTPREVWPQIVSAAQAGDFATADAKVAELIESGKPFGIRRYPTYAETTAFMARQAAGQNNEELSRWAIAAAQRLDAQSPMVAFTAADIARDRSNWAGAANWLFAGFGKVLSDRATATLARSDLMIVFSASLFLLSAALALVLLFRYGRAAAHDFREMLSPRFRAGVTTVLAFALLFLPLFLWMGPIWLILYWLLLFFGYASGPEKGAVVIMLLLLALLPVALDWTAYRIAGVETPIVRAALTAMENSYEPDSSRRLRELIQAVPNEPKLQLLMGNLAVQEGNEQEALVHYRRALALNEQLPGARVNIGNLHFFNNDFLAAINEFQQATKIQPDLAIAHYNSAVASGELYKFNEQGQKLAEAKKHDRALIDRLVASPPPQKVVMYELPVADAWVLTNRINSSGKARELFGNYASFSVSRSAVNPLTVGALLGLLLAVLVWMLRRGSGFADACIKCGRTFCHRCKSAREATTYCTQCIHIYLKRDGVSSDTKRAKMTEVQNYMRRHVRLKKFLTSFLPGSAQMLDGATIRGILMLLAFLLFVSLAVLIGRLAPLAPPAETMRFFVRSVAILLAVILWFSISIPVYRQRAMV